MLEIQHDRASHGIVTVDESRFCVSTEHEFVWLSQGEKVPEREKHPIQSKRFMLTIVWNPRGFSLIDVLAKGHKFNAPEYVPEILFVPFQSRSTEAKEDRRTLIVHADNAGRASGTPHFFFPLDPCLSSRLRPGCACLRLAAGLKKICDFVPKLPGEFFREGVDGFHPSFMKLIAL
jgi:hypothetical protein